MSVWVGWLLHSKASQTATLLLFDIQKLTMKLGGGGEERKGKRKWENSGTEVFHLTRTI